MKRLFVGLMLERELCQLVCRRVHTSLGELTENGSWRDLLKPTDPDGLHLTLSFLGEVDEQRVAPIARNLRENLRGLRAPRLRLSETGAFPGRGRERVLWVGLEEVEPGALEGLRDRVQWALHLAGCDVSEEPRTAFVPHLTVARVRRGPGVPRTLIPDEFYGLNLESSWEPRQVALVESVAAPRPGRGPSYQTLEQFDIGPR